MRKVLLIDDRRIFRELWMVGVRNHFHFLHATTVEQARNIFRTHGTVAAIVVDAHLGGTLLSYWGQPILEWGIDTRELIGEFRCSFTGPIIAAPSQWWHFQPMLRAGCSHYAWKWQVAALLKKLLL